MSAMSAMADRRWLALGGGTYKSARQRSFARLVGEALGEVADLVKSAAAGARSSSGPTAQTLAPQALSNVRFNKYCGESVISGERIVAVGLLRQRDIARLGNQFTTLWPVQGTPCFGSLLDAIDQADREIRQDEQTSGRHTAEIAVNFEYPPAGNRRIFGQSASFRHGGQPYETLVLTFQNNV